MECLCYCIAEQIDLVKAEKLVKLEQKFNIERSRNTMQVIDVVYHRVFYLFKNGTLITWNYHRYEAKKILKIIKNALNTPVDHVAKDQFSYHIGSSTKLWPHDHFNIDCMELENDGYELKLAISYGLSTSIKLNYYEANLEKQINKYLPLINQLTKVRRFSSFRKEINEVIGEIIATKSQINLSSDILYQPKFFWKHPNLEEYYDMIEKYMDISVRIEIINQQLETLNEIFEMFNSYLVNRHSHFLEVIIIVLIAVEIVFNLLNFHL